MTSGRPHGSGHWILQRVTGKGFATLLSERIWAPLGAEQDGYVWADPTGAQSTSVGINATLRDLGRLGGKGSN